MTEAEKIMSDPAVLLEISGIKCDAKDCDYEELGVEFTAKKYLNKPCPKCGANLFTEKDYMAMCRVVKTTIFINKWFSWLPRGKVISREIKMNGTGNIKIGKPE